MTLPRKPNDLNTGNPSNTADFGSSNAPSIGELALKGLSRLSFGRKAQNGDVTENDFETAHNGPIHEIVLQHGKFIDQIQVSYGKDAKGNAYGGSHSVKDVFIVPEGCFISRVIATYGVYIDSLQFEVYNPVFGTHTLFTKYGGEGDQHFDSDNFRFCGKDEGEKNTRYPLRFVEGAFEPRSFLRNLTLVFGYLPESLKLQLEKETSFEDALENLFTEPPLPTAEKFDLAQDKFDFSYTDLQLTFEEAVHPFLWNNSFSPILRLPGIMFFLPLRGGKEIRIGIPRLLTTKVRFDAEGRNRPQPFHPTDNPTNPPQEASITSEVALLFNSHNQLGITSIEIYRDITVKDITLSYSVYFIGAGTDFIGRCKGSLTLTVLVFNISSP